MVTHRNFSGRDFESMRQRMEKMLVNIFGDMRPVMFSAEKTWKPPIDIYETTGEIVVLVEIAGMKKKDINISMKNDLLTISGIRPDFSPATKMRLHQMEIDYGKFERIVKISLPIDTNKLRAQYREGFLKITLPKTQLKQPAVIEISPEE